MAAAKQTAEPQNAQSPCASPTVLPWREKISYGLADMGFNFYWANISTFLMIFYTDVFGISAAAAGSMLFTIKIINAFTDPVIGAAADRTTTRFGKFRPYLIWMAIPLAVAGVLTYSTPNLDGDGKLFWAYGTYLFMMTCYTGINIPYNALSGVMSSDRRSVRPLTACGSFSLSPAAPWSRRPRRPGEMARR